MTDTAWPVNLRYSLVLPTGWTSLDPQSPKLHQEVDRLVQKQLMSFGKSPNVMRELLRLVKTQADAAHDAGGVELHLSLMPTGAFTVPASLLVSVSPPGAPTKDLAKLQEALRGRAPDRRIEVVDLGFGEALRSRDHRAFQPDLRPPKQFLAPAHGASRGLAVSFGTTYYLPVPSCAGFLSLSFSSPLIALEDPLTELFDSIATTFRWI